MNIASLLSKTAQQLPDFMALSTGTANHCDYQTLAQRVAGIASFLRNKLNHQPGDRVALIMKNCPQYIEVLFAILHAGLTAVPINAKLHSKEFAYILQNSGASSLFITDDFLAQSEELVSHLLVTSAVLSVNSDAYTNLYNGAPLPMQACEPDSVAWLFYTSGTTGQPKGAMLSHRNLMTMTQSYFSSVDTMVAGDTLLHAAPMSHGSGLYTFPTVACGAAQVVCQSGSFEPAEITSLIHHYPQVSMFAAPTMIKRMVETPPAANESSDNLNENSANINEDTSNLKAIIYGGGPMYVADIKAAMKRFGNKFIQIYGQGETPMTITCLSRADHLARDDIDLADGHLDNRLASVGCAQMPVEIRIADEQGAPLADGEVGEILVKGDTVMLGYWGNPDATAETIVDGWLHTGDMGVMDQHGYLTLKDRSKDLIISGGTNIYPREVEEVLLQHPAILEVSVVGKPDPEWGEEVVAFVVLHEGEQLSDQQCDAWCLDNMARFKRPKSYYFVGELPKNNYGKVLKTNLRERLEKEHVNA
ncbi:MAG: long-chain fatty acid--CoA ligase [Gammaproteobacteria bacterium]|nr:MAG: long-chain fatty acid--CoA ligase [Gammaproteobacteria bacterium]